MATAAEAKDDIQPWPDVIITVPIGDKWSISGEAIGRIASQSGSPSQVEEQARVYRTLNEHLTLGGGYAHVVTYNGAARSVVDHQMVEELTWMPRKIAGFQLSLRTRLEQRFVTGTLGTSWRVREQIRARRSLGRTGMALSLWSEPFISLNRTSAATTTLDQVRSFAGIILPIRKGSEVEVGYLRQNIYRASGNVAINAIPIVLTLKF